MKEQSDDKEMRAQELATHFETRDCDQSSSCPSLKALAAFLDGGLPEDEAAAFERHLVRCRPCRDKLADSQLAREQEPLRLPLPLRHALLARVQEFRRRSFAELVYDAGRGILQGMMGSGERLQLQAAPARGGVGPTACKVTFGQVEIEIASDRRSDGSFDVWLRADTDGKGLPRCEWQLWDGNRLIEQQPSDSGEGWFNALAEGAYQFVLSASGREIGIVHLTLQKGENHE